MRFSIASSLLLLASAASAASTWGFADGSVLVSSKKAGSVTQKFTETHEVSKPITLGPADTLKVRLTTTDGGQGKPAHQAFFMVTEDGGTMLMAPFPLKLKDSGRGVVEITQKDLPVQILTSQETIHGDIVIGSFGSSKAAVYRVLTLNIQLDPNAPLPKIDPPVRYGKQPEIHHIFRADAKSPPKVISLVFALAVLSTVPALFVGWLALGANVGHLQKAFGAAPVSHAVFFGSIIAIEGAFFLYYSTWNLFQTLPVIAVLGTISFLSGTKALSEVQSRRLAGER